MLPKYAFGDQKGLIWNKDMPFDNPPYHETEHANHLKNQLFFFYMSWVKSGVLGRKTVFLGVSD